MDKKSNQNSLIHAPSNRLISSCSRSSKGVANVSQIGYVPRKLKGHRISFSGARLNIYILSGYGHLWIDDKIFTIKAPALFMCNSNNKGYFEVDSPDGWEEYWVNYNPSDELYLDGNDFKSLQNYVFKISRPDLVRTWLQQAFVLGEHSTSIGAADAIDRLCELARTGARLLRSEGAEAPIHKALNFVRNSIAQTPASIIDIDHLAGSLGLSRSTFLFHWNMIVGEPPKRHADRLRIARGCSILVEGNQSIKVISAKLGFADPLHFSRRFRQFVGQSPLQYRKNYRI
jgi:AraC family transcriptional regulator, arabinose operon regulatory protein